MVKYPDRRCMGCGKGFSPRRIWQKYCTPKCQVTHYNETHSITDRLRKQRQMRRGTKL